MWSTEDEEMLKEIRKISKLDRKSFSRYYCISESQLKQLEEGGSDSFYTEAIKYAAGRKLLKSCGLKTRFELIVKSPVNQELISEINVNDFSEEEAPLAKRDIFFKKWQLIGFFSILPIIGFLYYWQERKISTPVLSTLLDKPVSNLAPSNPVETKQEIPIDPGAIITDKSLTNLAVTDKQSTDLESVDSSQPTCNWTDKPVPVQPNNPSKNGNYVYFYAIEDVFFCVKDESGYSGEIKLNANKSRTITGVPPFKVYSNNINNIKIFYQGTRLVIPKSDIHEISITEIIR